MSSSNPTMKDVAREAGVALGTVSKVFNGIPVGEEYRRKVEEAAQRLGYKVNVYARGLKASKSNLVAVILPCLSHPFFGSLAEYCSHYLRARGCYMLIATTDYDLDAERKCIEMMQQNKVDGIICLSYNAKLEVDSKSPFVSIDRYYSTQVPCVASDNFGGGQLAAQKLTELGCTKLLCLRDASRVPGEVDKRNLGFDSWCQMNSVDHEVFLTYESQDNHEFFDFLDNHTTDGKLEYDGIFCGTDMLAYYVCKHLRGKGIRVPEDVQIIGYDGLQKFGNREYYCSTIVQPAEEMARTCVDIILNDNRDSLPPLMCLPVSYAYGGTTKQ